MNPVFTPRQISVLNRIGDILIPPGNGFVSFSESGALEWADEMMLPADPGDIKDLRLVLNLLGAMPDAVLKKLLHWCAAAHSKEGAHTVPLRQLDIGLRGIVYSLYYANLHGKDKTGNCFSTLGYELVCAPDAPENATVAP